jgi:NADH:ubiquinone oxidoreductase subunit
MIGSFKEWYNENKESDELRERYDLCCQDIEETGEVPPSFKKWMKEVWQEMQLNNG